MNHPDGDRQPDHDHGAVRAAWRGYLGGADPGAPVLPDADADLAPFLRDIIPGKPGEVWTHRAPVLTDHFRKLEPEFQGAPRLAHLTACIIVCLRRDPQDARALALFRRLVNNHAPDLATMLNSRWLASVCDTVIDTSESDLDRSVALVGSLLIGTLKVAETELRLYRPARPWPPKARLRHGGEFSDGLRTVWTGSSGDLDNIFLRVERGLRVASPVVPIVETLVQRAIEGSTVIQRIARISGQRPLPLATPDQLAALRAIMRGL